MNNNPKLIQQFTPPFRVGKKEKKAILDSQGREVLVFPSNEFEVQKYCDYLNSQYPVKQLVAKEEFYKYGQSLGIKINDLQRLMMLAKQQPTQSNAFFQGEIPNAKDYVIDLQQEPERKTATEILHKHLKEHFAMTSNVWAAQNDILRAMLEYASQPQVQVTDKESLVELLERRFVTADNVIIWNEQIKGLIDRAVNQNSK